MDKKKIPNLPWEAVLAAIKLLKSKGIIGGGWQEEVTKTILSAKEISVNLLKKLSKSIGDYERNFEALIRRLEKAGIKIEFVKTALGGKYVLTGVPLWLVALESKFDDKLYNLEVGNMTFSKMNEETEGMKVDYNTAKRLLELLKQRGIIKGSWQRDLVWELLLSGSVAGDVSRQIRGYASTYLDKYETSFNALMKRLKDAGFELEYTPGPRGGKWSSRYVLRSLPDWVMEEEKNMNMRNKTKKDASLAETVIKLNKALRRLFLEQTVDDLGETPAVPAGDDEDALVEPEVDTYELEVSMSAEVYQDLYQPLIDALRERGLEVEIADDGIALNSEDGYAIMRFVVLNGEPLIQWQLPSGVYSFTLAHLVGSVGSVEELVDRLSSEDIIDEFVDMVKAGFMEGEVELEVGSEEGDDLFDEIPTEDELPEPPPEEEIPLEEEPPPEAFEDEEVPPEDIFEEPPEEGEAPPPEGEEEEEEPSEEEEEEEREETRESKQRRLFRLRKRMKEQAEADDLASRIIKSFDFPSYYKKFEPREGQPDIISYVSEPSRTEDTSDESIA